MRIAVVMPRGSVMERDAANSMETVARTLLESSRLKSSVRVICNYDTHPDIYHDNYHDLYHLGRACARPPREPDGLDTLGECLTLALRQN